MSRGDPSRGSSVKSRKTHLGFKASSKPRETLLFVLWNIQHEDPRGLMKTAEELMRAPAHRHPSWHERRRQL